MHEILKEFKCEKCQHLYKNFDKSAAKEVCKKCYAADSKKYYYRRYGIPSSHLHWKKRRFAR